MAQLYRAEDSKKSDPLVDQIRNIMNGHPIAVCQGAADTIRDDIHRQLQFKKDEFQEPTV